MSSNGQGQQPQQEQTGLVGGHAEYVKGAAQSAIGSVTGSQAWTASGEQAKAHAVSAMKAAGDQRDAATQGWGKAGEVVGQAVGCEGLKTEGAESAKKE